MAQPIKNVEGIFPLRLRKHTISSSNQQVNGRKYADTMLEFIQAECFGAEGGFQGQHRVFATKLGWFLRPTVKLDPIAEFYFYDFVYRNRSLFRKLPQPNREVFGYRIVSGEPIPLMQSYQDYRAAIAKNRSAHGNYAYFDVSAYFNRIYHHDLVGWMEKLGTATEDVNAFGKFLRETASGRSVDCLPQGIYPAKMIGSAFLSFLEDSTRIRCSHSVRLMDDVWFFDDDPGTLIADFLIAQSLLSERGLSVNGQKSKIVERGEERPDLPTELGEMKVRLLQRRREELSARMDYDDDYYDDDVAELSSEEHEYLLSLLKPANVPEEDAELVLTLMQDHSSDILEYLPRLIRDFPGLAKRMYHFCVGVQDKAEVISVLLDYLKSGAKITEYQLFWFGMMAEQYLLKQRRPGNC